VKRKLFEVLTLMAFVLPVTAAAGDLGSIDIAAHESGVQQTRFVGKQPILYNYKWEMKRDGSRVTYSAKGDNNKKGPKRVEWVENVVMELTDGGVRTLVWAKDSSGAEQESWKIEYDWSARTAACTYADRASGKKEAKTVNFGAKAYSGDAMYFMLRGFPFEKGTGAKIEGEFVLTDGQIFTGAIINRGEEQLQTPLGALDTFKLEFKIGGAIGAFAPRMYIWMTKSEPHVFVRYEGKEEGLTKPRTVTDLIQYEPASRVKSEAPPATP
jgi:hypothetical protein